MRYVAKRQLQVPYHDGRRWQLAVLSPGQLAPIALSAKTAAPWVERGFMREVSDDEARRLPPPVDAGAQALAAAARQWTPAALA